MLFWNKLIIYFAPVTVIDLMKALIMGGGIAGLAAAITLRKGGWNVSVQERAPEFIEVGLGFIILPNGLEALDTVGAGDYVRRHGKTINKATIRTPDGTIIKDDVLDSCLGIKRSSCIDALRSLLPAEVVKTGAEFSHFEYEANGEVAAAHFTNGTREEADIFIAADGANSAVRKMLFPSHIVGSTKIKEMVGIADLPDVVQALNGRLLKTQSLDEGLSIGLLPCNDKQVIWYMQFDCMKNDIVELSAANKQAFAHRLVGSWPDPISYVLQHTDYNKVFLWFTKDMSVLPAFHKNNVVLAGDAAHLVLPFTSQGVNSALQDVIILGRLLKDGKNIDSYDDVFTTYYQCRKEILEEYHLFGKMMAKRFLDPLHYKNDDVPLPLAK
jgi:2-polyprenyl-6-methoxyphenol hydroxylase-like FAD-dependent oxidoreductase